MKQDPEMEAATEKILAAIQKKYGFVPPINQIMSERPDVFVPSAEFSRAVLDRDDGAIEPKYRFLCAISAAAAVGGEYCLRAQIKHAKEAGATEDEVFESIMIGTYMSMTRAQSYALRVFAESYDVKYD